MEDDPRDIILNQQLRKNSQLVQIPQHYQKDHGHLRLDHKKLNAKNDVGRIRTYAPEGNRFQVCRDNHSATTPCGDNRHYN